MQKQIFFFSVKDTNDFNRISLDERRVLLGNKGANLSEMCILGIPVPPGFILGTELCRGYNNQKLNLSDEITAEIMNYVRKLSDNTGKVFGSNINPLLLSVRSGAIVSMPGMMDTVLNVGLNDEVVEGLAKIEPNFAYDSYRRLIQMYGSVVLEIEEEKFNQVLVKYNYDIKSSLQTIKETIKDFKQIILDVTGDDFPQDVTKQLTLSIEAVFHSWDSDRAKVYRDKNNIDHNLSTAATVQTMVFGNMNENSCTGVLFTRNPISGEKAIFGEFLPRAQGEDVVAGYTTTYPLTKLDAERVVMSASNSMEVLNPNIFRRLKEIGLALEKHYCDMQDIEFTVQEGDLWILQTRNGKRSPGAALKIAIDLVAEGLQSEEEALKTLDSKVIEQSIHKQLVTSKEANIIAKGLAASPGAASGVIALTPERAEVLSKCQTVILVRNETSPEDIAGMYAAEGILTARGGVTSHAAVVARGIGKPCICSVENLIIEEDSISLNGIIFREGDQITINGSTGEVFDSSAIVTAAGVSDELLKVIAWTKKHKKISVLANAETPEDVMNAIKFGAEGIGLCRTEHMFFYGDRINDVRNMILASTLEERQSFLEKISSYQKADFKELFKTLDGKVICIRLLDPPLHEFLPQTEKDILNFCKVSGKEVNKVRNKIKSLHEHNPMLGHRGARLCLTYPEIYASQAKAIFEAMIDYRAEENKDARVEIMIPLIFSENELIFIKNIIEDVRKELFSENKLQYEFGAMIELPRMALLADRICDQVSFVSFGTNDLTQTTFGISRDDSGRFLRDYRQANILESDPFTSIDKDGVGALLKIAISKIKAKDATIKIGVCGEQGGDEDSIEFFSDLGVDYVSCSPYRVPAARLIASKIKTKFS